MNWEAIGAVSEIIGAVAVVVTLGYLALQIRQQNASNSLNVKNSVLDGISRVNQLMAADQELAVLFNKGLFTPDDLSDGEAAQFSWILRNYANVYIKLYQLHKEGLLSPSDWESHSRQFSSVFNSRGGRQWLQGHTGTFQDVVEELVRVPSDDLAIDLTLGRKSAAGAGARRSEPHSPEDLD